MAIIAVLAAAALSTTGLAAGVVAPLPERTPGNVEVPVGEASDPLKLEVGYVADIFSGVSGGRQKGTRYIDSLNVIASADLDQLAGISRTTATIQAFHNNGKRFSGSIAGDAQGISGIETGTRMTRIYEAWFEHRGAGDRWSIKAGLYDINSEFDALGASLLFVHSAHGLGTDISQSGRNGPSTYPDTALGVRGEFRVHDGLTIRAAVLDGVPNDPGQPRRMLVRFNEGEGAFLIAEADASFGSVRVLLGGWHYTSANDNRLDAGVAAPMVHRSHSAGAYLRGEAQLSGTAERGLRGFARLGAADGHTNEFSGFLSGGLSWRGLIRQRPDDETGFALAYALAGRATRRLSRAMVGSADRGELVIEATHRIKLTEWLSVQPDVQYVVNPGLDRSLKDAVAVGLRLSASFAL